MVELDIKQNEKVNDYLHLNREEEKQPESVGTVKSLMANMAYNLGSAHASQANDLYGKASELADEKLASFEECLSAL